MWGRRRRRLRRQRQVWVGRGVYHLIFPLAMLLLLLLSVLRAKAQARLLDHGGPLRRHVQRGAGVGRHRLQAPEEERGEGGWVNRDSRGRVGTMSVSVNVNVNVR